MALKKKFLKSKPLCKVSFELPLEAAPQAKTVELMGSFNNWQPIAMRKVKDRFTRTVDLPVESEHQFRYRINGETWLNDAEADAYVANGIDAENSVVRVFS